MSQKEQLFYDTDCPMCSWYTSQMEDKGLLKKGVRTPHHHIRALNSSNLDVERSRDEIALYNHQSGETLYGLEAMLHLVGRQFPRLERIGRIPWVKWSCQKVYRFVSFNRQIIASNGKKPTALDCTPHYHRGYRWAFVVFAALVSVALTWGFANWFDLDRNGIFWAITTGWLVFFLTTLPFFNYRKWFDLTSHTASVMLQGVLIFGATLPFIYWTPQLLSIPVSVALILCSFVVMNKGMLRRMKRLELSRKVYFWWLFCLTASSGLIVVFGTKILELWMF